MLNKYFSFCNISSKTKNNNESIKEGKEKQQHNNNNIDQRQLTAVVSYGFHELTKYL
jgi:hypothetical protein